MNSKNYKLTIIAAAAILALAIIMGIVFGGFAKSVDLDGGVVVTIRLPLEHSVAQFEKEIDEMPEIVGKADITISDPAQDTIIYIVKAKEINVGLDEFKAALDAKFVEPVGDDALAEVHECDYIRPVFYVSEMLYPALAIAVSFLAAAVYMVFRFGWQAALSAFASAIISPVIMLSVMMIIRIEISKSIVSAVFLASGAAFVLSAIAAIISAYNDKNISARESTREAIRQISAKQFVKLIIVSAISFAAIALVGIIFQTRLMRELLVAYIAASAAAFVFSYWAMFGLRIKFEAGKLKAE